MERIETTENRRTMPWLFLELAVVFSVCSQIEPIEAIARPAMYIMWIIVMVSGVLNKGGVLSFGSFSRTFFIAYLLFCALCAVVWFFDNERLTANYIRVLLIPLMVTIVGDLFSGEDRALINRLVRLYLICSVIFAFWVQRTYFPSYSSWLRASMYLFREKNSAGQIWIAAIFSSLLLLDYRSDLERLLIYLLCGYLFIMTGFSQSRTALLGSMLAVAAFAILRAENKLAWSLLVATMFIVVWFIPVTHSFIEKALFLSRFDGTNLDVYSSGRLSRYAMTVRDIQIEPFFGLGSYYVDCSYLLILAESGLVGFAIVEWIWGSKILSCFRYRGRGNERYFLFMMTIFYLCESVLEGYPPFGPGVSTFMYWLLSSLVINRTDDDDEDEDDDEDDAPETSAQGLLPGGDGGSAENADRPV